MTHHLFASSQDRVTLYERDYSLWLTATLQQLQDQDLANLDWEHLIEEIAGLGNEQRRKVCSYLRQLLVHLLLYQYWEQEKAYCGNGWKAEIRNFRAELEFLLQSTTLKNYLIDEFAGIYVKARKITIDKTGLSEKILPTECIYSLEQVLDSEFLPE